ncbi:hypothetical protein GTQ99_14205 [Kineococcus sp. T13]|uniref:hypothetical protein n=1 Tax=Kineococcus vitellinus TaxID=2696565 RepID=UPI001412BBF1|nr:hypothetical protein [Kineococcus vitellinus]NAZ76560.1 hypothetical protein [Kineococcus vitellinus]
MITRRPARRRAAVPAPLAVGLAALLAGCGGEEAPDPSPTTTTTRPTGTATSSPSATASPSPTGPGFDCASVDAAQGALDDAFAAELDRLDIGRGDPRAQSVYVLVTTSEGPAYYAAVLAAAPPEQAADAQLVLDYYQRLAARAGALDAGDGSTEDLLTAMDRLDEAAAAVGADPAAGTRVVDAQERLQAAVEAACTSPTASATSTATGTATSTATGTATSTATAAG